MTRPQPVHARPGGPLFVFDPDTGGWVEHDGVLDGGAPDSTYDGSLDGGQPDTEF